MNANRKVRYFSTIVNLEHPQLMFYALHTDGRLQVTGQRSMWILANFGMPPDCIACPAWQAKDVNDKHPNWD